MSLNFTLADLNLCCLLPFRSSDEDSGRSRNAVLEVFGEKGLWVSRSACTSCGDMRSCGWWDAQSSCCFLLIFVLVREWVPSLSLIVCVSFSVCVCGLELGGRKRQSFIFYEGTG